MCSFSDNIALLAESEGELMNLRVVIHFLSVYMRQKLIVNGGKIMVTVFEKKEIEV